jgi:hypothetical protein
MIRVCIKNFKVLLLKSFCTAKTRKIAKNMTITLNKIKRINLISRVELFVLIKINFKKYNPFISFNL